MAQGGRFEVGEGKLIPAEAKSRPRASLSLLRHIAQKQGRSSPLYPHSPWPHAIGGGTSRNRAARGHGLGRLRYRRKS